MEDSSKKIQASTVTLLGPDSFLQQGHQYIVPVYQRPYNWGELEIRRLFQTLIKNFRSKEETFLGTLLCLPRGKSEPPMEFEVVDGQQRLTTMALFVKYLQMLQTGVDRTGLYPDDQPSPNWLASLGSFDLPGFPEEKWLTSEVNKKKEGEDLHAVLEMKKWGPYSSEEEDAWKLNRYYEGLRQVAFAFEDLWDDVEEGSSLLDPSKFREFLAYVGNKVSMVLIIARTGLTQALAIFDTINTTGMALDTGDLFKVRVYEFLRRTDGSECKHFDDIDQLYTRIKEKNKTLHEYVRMDMPQVLDWYRHILVARNYLPVALHDYGADRFWDEYFRTVLMHESLENFSKVKPLSEGGANQTKDLVAPIDLKEIERLIDVRALLDEGAYPYTETACRSMKQYYMVRLNFFTRYGWRYWWLFPIYAFRFWPEGSKEEAIAGETDFTAKFEAFSTLLTKCFAILSVRYVRVVYEGHQFAHRVAESILTAENGHEGVMELLRGKHRELKENYEPQIRNHLHQAIYPWPSYCRLILMLAMIAEEDLGQLYLHTRIFDAYDEGWDVEHILPQTPHAEEDEAIRNALEPYVHHLGNLTFLPPGINRGQSNDPYLRKRGNFQLDAAQAINLNRFATTEEVWNLDAFQRRNAELGGRVLQFLFEVDEVTPSS